MTYSVVSVLFRRFDSCLLTLPLFTFHSLVLPAQLLFTFHFSLLSFALSVTLEKYIHRQQRRAKTTTKMSTSHSSNIQPQPPPAINTTPPQPPPTAIPQATIEEFKTLLENDVRIKVAGIDLDGILRGKIMAKTKFLSVLQSGFGFCSVIFGWDMHDKTYAEELSVSNAANGNLCLSLFTCRRYVVQPLLLMMLT